MQYMDDLRLQPLDPVVDLELYRIAYNWRSTPKRHTSAPQLPFEAFTEINPTHLTIGLFNGDLLAIYFLREWEPTKYEAHFTSKRGVPRETLLLGAKAILNLMLDNGATEVAALILPTNRPLRQFVTELGMTKESHVIFTCITETQGGSIEQRNKRPVFIKYVKRS